MFQCNFFSLYHPYSYYINFNYRLFGLHFFYFQYIKINCQQEIGVTLINLLTFFRIRKSHWQLQFSCWFWNHTIKVKGLLGYSFFLSTDSKESHEVVNLVNTYRNVHPSVKIIACSGTMLLVLMIFEMCSLFNIFHAYRC